MGDPAGDRRPPATRPTDSNTLAGPALPDDPLTADDAPVTDGPPGAPPGTEGAPSLGGPSSADGPAVTDRPLITDRPGGTGGRPFAYSLYTAFAALALFFVLRAVPETKGREPEDM